MTAQHNSLTFHDLCLFLPNSLSYIYKKLSSCNQTKFQPLFKLQLNNLIYLIVFCQVTPTFSIGPVVGKINWFVYSVSLLFNLIYSLPTSSSPWNHPKRQLKTVFFFLIIIIRLGHYIPTFSWTWHHSVTIHKLQLYPNIFICQTIPRVHFVFYSRCLVTSLEKYFINFQLTLEELFSIQGFIPHLSLSSTT